MTTIPNTETPRKYPIFVYFGSLGHSLDKPPMGLWFLDSRLTLAEVFSSEGKDRAKQV